MLCFLVLLCSFQLKTKVSGRVRVVFSNLRDNNSFLKVIHSSFHLFIHSFFHPFIRSFFHPFIHSSFHPFLQPPLLPSFIFPSSTSPPPPQAVEGDIHDVIKQAIGHKHLNAVDNCIEFEGRVVVISTRGKCRFKYGVEQLAEVDQVAL